MSFLFYIGLAIVLALVLLAILNRRAFSSLAFWSRSQAGKAGRFFASNDPVTQMRQAADDAGYTIRQARDALVKSKALEAGLAKSAEDYRHEVAVLEKRINKRLDAGDNPEQLTQMAEELSRAKKSLENTETQIASNAKFYVATMEVVKRESEKLSSIQQRADRLQVRLDMSKAQADLADLNDRFQPSSLHDAMNTASKFEAAAEAKIAENAARLQVNTELRGTDWEAEEESAGADAVMADIMAKRTAK